MTSHPNDEAKGDLILRLKRVEGQIRGVLNMVENDADCEKVAQQMSACRKALDRAFHRMIACMIQQSLTDSDSFNDAAKKHLQQMTDLLAKFA